MIRSTMRMKILAVFAVVLLSWTLCTGEKATQCSLAGLWKNDLGSNLTINQVFKNGTFTGTYLTAVSSTPRKITISQLVGFQQLTDFPTFGFTVRWNFSDSITVFTGQCFKDESGKKVLQTTWLLRSKTEKAQDDWAQTRVGYNIFRPLNTE